MNKLAITLAITGFLTGTINGTAQANSAEISGTLYKQTAGTTFDTWHIHMETAGTLTFNVLAYEATQSSTSTAGYSASDINGDGELTWLDPDTYFYADNGTGVLTAADKLTRCDDIANNCSTVDTPTIKLTSLTAAEGALDGSIHFRRDPAFNVTLAAGDYLYLFADYTLTTTEAIAGINTGDSFTPPTGFVNPILDHAAYRVTLNSSDSNIAVSGLNITVSSVPVPSAIWLFGSAIAGAIGLRRKQAV